MNPLMWDLVHQLKKQYHMRCTYMTRQVPRPWYNPFAAPETTVVEVQWFAFCSDGGMWPDNWAAMVIEAGPFGSVAEAEETTGEKAMLKYPGVANVWTQANQQEQAEHLKSLPPFVSALDFECAIHRTYEAHGEEDGYGVYCKRRKGAMDNVSMSYNRGIFKTEEEAKAYVNKKQ